MNTHRSTTSTHQTPAATVVLHALKAKGLADEAFIAEFSGLDVSEVRTHLADASTRGLCTYSEGRLVGWRLTAEGREEHLALIAADLAAADATPDLETAYDGFLELNEPFKELCTEWQLQGQPDRCVDGLRDVHERLRPVVDLLASRIERFVPYEERFGAALARLVNGDADAFTKPLAGSYHDLWMELHQDLLLTLGRQRSNADGS